MKVTVFVMPKKNVLDPQGAAVGHAMTSHGFPSLKEARIGKVIELDIEGEDTPEFRERIDGICRELLSNPVIEDYRYEVNSSGK